MDSCVLRHTQSVHVSSLEEVLRTSVCMLATSMRSGERHPAIFETYINKYTYIYIHIYILVYTQKSRTRAYADMRAWSTQDEVRGAHVGGIRVLLLLLLLLSSYYSSSSSYCPITFLSSKNSTRAPLGCGHSVLASHASPAPS